MLEHCRSALDSYSATISSFISTEAGCLSNCNMGGFHCTLIPLILSPLGDDVQNKVPWLPTPHTYYNFNWPLEPNRNCLIIQLAFANRIATHVCLVFHHQEYKSCHELYHSNIEVQLRRRVTTYGPHTLHVSLFSSMYKRICGEFGTVTILSENMCTSVSEFLLLLAPGACHVTRCCRWSLLHPHNYGEL